jgi:sugar lactone lactonase YvrE
MRRLAPTVLLPLLLAGCWAAGPIDAVAWEPPAPPPAATPEHALERADLLRPGGLAMPEDVAVDPGDREAAIYTGIEDGRIMKITARHRGEPVATTFATLAHTPLGLKFDAQGTLLACVSGHGLVAVDRAGVVRDLVTEVGGRKLVFANDLDVGPDGVVYFTESSRSVGVEGAGPIRAIAQNRPDGTLFAHDRRTGATRPLLEGLYFPNGVTVTHGGQALLVAETSRYRLRRYWLAGPKAGTDEVVPHPLPGIPDGLMADGAGTVWVALVPRDGLLDALGPHPWARNLLARFPDGLLTGMASGKSLGMVAALDEEGRVRRVLVDDTGRFEGGIANVAPVGRNLYFGTKWGDWVAVLPLAP